MSRVRTPGCFTWSVAGVVHYAMSGGLAIAWAEYGSGDVTFVLIPGLLGHLDFNEEIPYYRPFIHRLSDLGRLIVLDKRGCGLSDRSRLGSPEEQVADVLAVMDDAGVTDAVVIGAVGGVRWIV